MRELAHHKTREFAHHLYVKQKRYRSFHIPKKSGGKRQILAPPLPLALWQKTLADLLTNAYERKKGAYGFCIGGGIVANSKRHIKARVILNLDLLDFFDSIHFGRVRGVFQAKPFTLPTRTATILAKICCWEKKLPQGAPTSPILSNYVCRKLDTDLGRLAQKYRCQYTRYAEAAEATASIPRHTRGSDKRSVGVARARTWGPEPLDFRASPTLEHRPARDCPEEQTPTTARCPSAIGPHPPRTSLTCAVDWYVLPVTHSWPGLAVVLIAFGCGDSTRRNQRIHWSCTARLSALFSRHAGQSSGHAPGTPAGRGPCSRTLPLVGRLALASSLGLGAIQCASERAETSPAPTPAAAPERPPAASVHEAAIVAPRYEEQAAPAPATPTSESQASPPPATPTSESQASPPAPVPESASADPTPAPSRKLEVVARLVEPKSTAGCGVLHIVVVMRYEIIDVLEGTYGERELYAAHSCPEMGMGRCPDLAGKGARRFKAGDVHHLRLDQRSRGGVLFDLFSDKTLPRYRVTCGNLVPPESP